MFKPISRPGTHMQPPPPVLVGVLWVRSLEWCAALLQRGAGGKLPLACACICIASVVIVLVVVRLLVAFSGSVQKL